MKKFLQDFKAFAMKGNVVDMAIGVIIGGAFGKIVTSLVNDVIMPLIGLAVGGVNFKELKWMIREAYVNDAGQEIAAATLNYGNFLQVTFDFLIIALSIFVMIRVIGNLSRKKEAEKAAAPAPTAAAGSIKIEAGAAGKVFKLEKKVGDKVEKGDAVLILEAMKMEIPVVAPEAGTVASINVAVGDTVESGALLATLN